MQTPKRASEFPSLFYKLEAKEQNVRSNRYPYTCRQCGRGTKKGRQLTIPQVYELLAKGIAPERTYHKLCGAWTPNVSRKGTLRTAAHLNVHLFTLTVDWCTVVRMLTLSGALLCVIRSVNFSSEGPAVRDSFFEFEFSQQVLSFQSCRPRSDFVCEHLLGALFVI